MDGRIGIPPADVIHKQALQLVALVHLLSIEPPGLQSPGSSRLPLPSSRRRTLLKLPPSPRARARLRARCSRLDSGCTGHIPRRISKSSACQISQAVLLQQGPAIAEREEVGAERADAHRHILQPEKQVSHPEQIHQTQNLSLGQRVQHPAELLGKQIGLGRVELVAGAEGGTAESGRPGG